MENTRPRAHRPSAAPNGHLSPEAYAEIERRFAELIGREPRKLRGARHRPCEHLPGAVTNRSRS